MDNQSDNSLQPPAFITHADQLTSKILPMGVLRFQAEWLTESMAFHVKAKPDIAIELFNVWRSTLGEISSTNHELAAHYSEYARKWIGPGHPLGPKVQEVYEAFKLQH